MFRDIVLAWYGNLKEGEKLVEQVRYERPGVWRVGEYLIKNGRCNCPVAQRPGLAGWCAHRFALELYQARERSMASARGKA